MATLRQSAVRVPQSQSVNRIGEETVLETTAAALPSPNRTAVLRSL
jgi:hypothetical protein